MATHDQMQQLIKVCLKCGINESVVTYSKLMRSGFVVLSGNNESFKKLNESETCFEAKQINESSWLIKDKTKKLSNDEWDNLKNYYDKNNTFNKLDNIKLNQISEEVLKDIWYKNDLEEKRNELLNIINDLNYNSKSVQKIVESVKESDDEYVLNSIVTNLIFIKNKEN